MNQTFCIREWARCHLKNAAKMHKENSTTGEGLVCATSGLSCIQILSFESKDTDAVLKKR
jgi:hypothetical protein